MNKEDFDKKYKYFTDLGYWRERNNLCIEYIKSLEEQNQGLQSLLDLKQQEISVLESKVGELEDSVDNSDEAIRRRYAKWEYPDEAK